LVDFLQSVSEKSDGGVWFSCISAFLLLSVSKKRRKKSIEREEPISSSPTLIINQSKFKVFFIAKRSNFAG
jgi:hypothetical protein